MFVTDAQAKLEVGILDTNDTVTINTPTEEELTAEQQMILKATAGLDLEGVVHVINEAMLWKKGKVHRDDTPQQLADAIGTQVHGTATGKRLGFKGKKKGGAFAQFAEPPDLKTPPAPRVANG